MIFPKWPAKSNLWVHEHPALVALPQCLPGHLFDPGIEDLIPSESSAAAGGVELFVILEESLNVRAGWPGGQQSIFKSMKGVLIFAVCVQHSSMFLCNQLIFPIILYERNSFALRMLQLVPGLYHQKLHAMICI